ncbi:hypothetical protein EV424DRAFT_1546253 [Suillus variegatus]|nr:hypothetical protein EV424DRAFT_1546253 [Suillus variegatus]
MTVPPEQANHALNITLAALQSLMKRCIKVKEGDPEALRLSDEIARRVAKDLKLYGGNATSFSPQLLSFAAVTTDPRIKSHPRFDKTVDYLPPSSLDELVIATTATANPPTVPAMATAIIPPSTPLASPSKPSLTDSHPKDQSFALSRAHPTYTPHLHIAHACALHRPSRSYRLLSIIVQARARLRAYPPHLSLTRASRAPYFPASTSARLVDRVSLHLIREELLSVAVLWVELYSRIQSRFLTFTDILAGPESELKGSSDLGKEKVEDPPIPINTPAAPPTKYNLFVASTKKRKAVEEDTDTVVVVAKTKLPSPSEEPVKKRKITSKTISKTELVSDEDIATPWKHSVRYHPRQCDKCAKLDIACLVLPDKKFGYMGLACANCDSMKITCAIDGVGVWQRLQAKAAKASSNPPKQLKASTSRAVSKTPMTRVSRLQWSIVQHKEEIKPVLTNLLEPEPTAREILQGIQDLGRRLDLLAANERVDALEVRVDLMETNLLKRLDGLEQRLNESNAWWKSLESQK